MSRPHHSKTRTILAALAIFGTSLISASAFSACADPEGDYKDFQARTNGIRGVVPSSTNITQTDGGSTCTTNTASTPPDYSSSGVPDFSGEYFAECLARIAVCDTHKGLRYKGIVQKQSDGSYQATYTPLLIDADVTSMTDGPAFPAVSFTVAADGTFHQMLDGVNTPGSANPFSGNDLTVDALFTGYVTSASTYCAELDGDVVVLGAPIDLNGPGDICLFRKVTGDSDPVDFQLSEFHCP